MLFTLQNLNAWNDCIDNKKYKHNNLKQQQTHNIESKQRRER